MSLGTLPLTAWPLAADLPKVSLVVSLIQSVNLLCSVLPILSFLPFLLSPLPTPVFLLFYI